MTQPGNEHATIVLLPGDGIGPEVVAAARVVLDAVARRFDQRFDYVEALIGGAAIDATGTPLPDETVAACSTADAALLGAVGGPQWDALPGNARPEQGLLRIRKALGLFANVRPVRAHPATADASPLKFELLADVDLVVVRELTGGIYFGEKSLETHAGGERATDVCTYTTEEIERVVRAAAQLARARRRRLTSVDKANVLETSRLWRRVTTRVMSEEFPDVELDHLLVDSAAMELVRAPSRFDVIVTENMFGDILTDEAAVLAGSIGLLPSASLGAATTTTTTRRFGLYEPIHGSAPTIAGRGIANPMGAILSAALLLRHSLGMDAGAEAIERAVARALDRRIGTPDIFQPGRSTEQVTVAIVDELRSVPWPPTQSQVSAPAD
jgi:3-isopropylmalate dehydrogenase